jgi:hypothetical protein
MGRVFASIWLMALSAMAAVTTTQTATISQSQSPSPASAYVSTVDMRSATTFALIAGAGLTNMVRGDFVGVFVHPM